MAQNSGSSLELRTDDPMSSIIRPIIETFPDVRAIYLFGSWGKPFEREDSDIDLAVLLQHPIANIERWNLAQNIAKSMRKNVDLIDLISTSTVMRQQILASGIRIYCDDIPYAESFESRALSDYVRLNEERKDILNAIREKGSIYAR